MPTYTFKNIESGVEEDIFITSDELDSYIKDNPQLQQVFKFPGIVSDSGQHKPDSGFRDVLKRIKNASGSTNTVETY